MICWEVDLAITVKTSIIITYLLLAIRNLTETVVRMDARLVRIENSLFERDLSHDKERVGEEALLPKLPAATADEIVAIETFLESPGNAKLLVSNVC